MGPIGPMGLIGPIRAGLYCPGMDVRRRFAAVRGSRLLAVGLIVVGGYLFANNLTPWPRYVVRTEAKLDRGLSFRGPYFWGHVEAVSDDGRQVTIGIHRGPDTRLEVWDTRTGTDQTPEHWKDPDWQRLVSGPRKKNGRDAGLTGLLPNPGGRALLHDGPAWVALRERLTIARAKHIADVHQTVRPVRGEGIDGSPFPDSLHFSPDGRFVSYVARNGWPVYLLPESDGDGTVIEDARTGRRMAFLPGVTAGTQIGTDGRTAVTGDFTSPVRLFLRVYGRSGGAEPSLLTLWDLETATKRAELEFPDPDFVHVEYTPAGRFLIAQSGSLLRWWDTDTGRQVGEAGGAWHRQFLDGRRVLVVSLEDNQAIRFWDVPTGRELDEWELPNPPGQAGLFGRLLAAGGDRYLVAEFNDPDSKSDRSFPLLDRVVDRLTDKLPDRPATDRSRVVVLDGIDRRVSRPVPGREAALSANGRWLATLDADGVVRVWPVSLGRPWVRGLVYAAAVVLGGWGVGRLVGRVRRRLWPRSE
jgi:hypothetical protein